MFQSRKPMNQLMCALEILEHRILKLPLTEREQIQTLYHKSLTRFRSASHKERGELNYGKAWKPDEEALLRSMTNKGVPDEEIAKRLMRSVKGIQQHRQKNIVQHSPALSTLLVQNFTPACPDSDFIIPQHRS